MPRPLLWAAAIATIVVLLAIVTSGASREAVAAPVDPADLRLTKSDSPDPVTEGNVLTYTITVQNLGPDPAENVVVSDKLPNVDFVSATASQGTCDRNGRNVTCNLGTVAASVAAKAPTVTIRVRPQKEGTIENTAEVDSTTTDPQKANNTATATTRVVARPTPTPTAATCRGVAATVVGTPAGERLNGTGGPDVVAAFGGNDVVVTNGGHDRICLGSGNDLTRAGTAADRVFGGAGADREFGNGGPDVLRGNRGSDRLFGGRGNDRLFGGPGNDLCFGGPGFDLRRSC